MHLRSRAPRLLASSLTPFLYPCLDNAWLATRVGCTRKSSPSSHRQQSTAPAAVDVNQYDHLDPAPPDYSSTPFIDACSLTVAAGAGGHGCISFLREKYIPNGPPNGGDGGTGGSVYIQAVQGETSLHKIARRGHLKADRGRNGQGSLKGGARGEDMLLQVPVGTVVREVWRRDPVSDEEKNHSPGFGFDAKNDDPDDARPDKSRQWRRDKWLLYPGTLPKSFTSGDFPALPRPRRSNLTAMQPACPLRLDLDKPMDKPMLLAAGAMGGLGNPHFVTKSVPRPKYATKGEEPLRIHVQLELKLLADVGLVGLPNAGKSTLLRALTKSRTRVGDWAFTTLAPTIGTLVLDDYKGRPQMQDMIKRAKRARTSISIADIPGLIEDAHLDRGLGLGFLRHIERAAVLAFVVDLSARDAVAALKSLWREVGEYETLRERELNTDTEHTYPRDMGVTTYKPFEDEPSEPSPPGFPNEEDEDVLIDAPVGRNLPALTLPPISSKPWFVVATKADLPDTQENFLSLRQYLERVQNEEEPHPGGKPNPWRKTLHAIPVSGIRKEGIESIPGIVLSLLND